MQLQKGRTLFFYQNHIGGELFNLVFYLVLYVLATVLIFGRKVPHSIAFHVRAKAGKQQTKPKFVDTPLVCFIILFLHFYLFLRMIPAALFSIRNVVVLSNYEYYSEHPAVTWMYNIGNAVDAYGYPFVIILFSCVVSLWTDIVAVWMHNAQTRLSKAVTVIHVIIGLISVVLAAPIAIVYLVNLGDSPTSNLVLYIIAPIGIILFTLSTLIALGYGIAVLVVTRRTGPKGAEVVFIKMGSALVLMCVSNTIRALGFALFTIKPGPSPWTTSSLWPMCTRGLPDGLTALCAILLFWPFKSHCSNKRTVAARVLEPSYFDIKRRDSNLTPYEPPTPAATSEKASVQEHEMTSTPTAGAESSPYTPATPAMGEQISIVVGNSSPAENSATDAQVAS